MRERAKESWGASDAYEQYVGRWSRLVAVDFLRWLSPPRHAVWADIGCGTGALTECILATYAPASIAALDRSEGFLAATARRIAHPQVRLQAGDAAYLPWAANSFDVAVSGLVLNFVPDHAAMIDEMARVTRAGGTVASYVWDYAGGMEMMRHFWDAAVAVSPQDAKLDQADRFPVCRPSALESLFRSAGLDAVTVRALEIPTRFRSFDDYWRPFLGAQGSAPTYLAALDGDRRTQIRETLRRRLPTAKDGSIILSARAWAVRGTV